MTRLYQSPLRVYLALGALALWGLIAGFQLPVSLFPNSSKPTVVVNLNYGDMSANEFLNTYGHTLESRLQGINDKDAAVDLMTATYDSGYVRYKMVFKWGGDQHKALSDVQNIMSAFVTQLSPESRDSLGVWAWSDGGGFIALSFYSKTRSLDELYKFLEPQLVPPCQRVPDASDADLWNPNQKEVRIEMNPEKAALLQVFPKDVSSALLGQLQAYRGGSMTEGLNQLNIEMPPVIRSVDDLRRAVIPTPTGATVHLSDFANIDFGTPSTNSRSMKTSGVPSLILEAEPKPGGNVKRMAEDILAIVDANRKNWPSDIEYRVLVDPSEFIRSAVNNVVHEVVVAALLAVLVLFLFIGNIRNVMTAAIEIPLSIVLAFILMKMMGINLNLISLGGLALSAGMNVDGSVVVMENIFRHFDMAKGPLTYKDRVKIIGDAVAEVRFPIIASTIASLVVFIPLAFTSALTNAILGDLALAVVFSHGFSAVVSLILVPTVRLQLMSRASEKSSHSFLEPVLKKIELYYSIALGKFMEKASLKSAVYLGLIVALVALGFGVLPNLPREIVGKPDTDWLILVAKTRGNTLIRQMDSFSESVEAQLLDKFGDQIRYTFTQTSNPNSTNIMARLKDKSKMQELWTKWEAQFANTPDVTYAVVPWNPSELQIPDPPNFELSVRGNDADDRIQVARDIYDLLNDAQIYPRMSATPDLSRLEVVNLVPAPEQWSALATGKAHLSPSDVADVSRTATLGKRLWQMPIAGEIVPIMLSYGDNHLGTVAELESLPVGVAGKLVPLKALTRVQRTSAPLDPYRENGTDRIMITGRMNKGDEAKAPAAQKSAEDMIEKWKKESGDKHSSAVTIEDANHELTEALHQLGFAVGLSILLIFITMVFQFGDVVNAILVLVAIPLGFIGVLISLYVFHSTLSLNSVLGVILLNGISVANSIILVDFLKRLVDKGQEPREAAIEAARARLRPILMTSLTTGLGMLPVALGFGEGGKILQPLGIAVVGGLAFSMATTLFIVPSLQVSYLTWKRNHRPIRSVGTISASIVLGILLFAQPSHASDLSFSEAMQEMTAKNVDLQIQETHYRSAEQSVSAARGSFTPQLYLQAQSQNLGGAQVAVSGGLPSYQVLSANATWNVFRSGADVAALRASLANRDSQKASLDEEYLQAEGKAAIALLTYIEANLAVEAYRRSEVSSQHFLEIAELRFKRSLLSREEMDKVATDEANAEARRADAEIVLNGARQVVESLLGHSHVQVAWPWENAMAPANVHDLMTDTSLAKLMNRPDVQAAQTALDSEDLHSRQLWRTLLPTVDLTLSESEFRSNGVNEDGWSSLATLTIPLWSGLRDYSAYRIQVESKNAAEARLRQLERDVESGTRLAQNNYKVAYDQYVTRKRNLLRAQHILDQDEARFKIGRSDANELNLDLSRVTEAEILTVQGIEQAHGSYVTLWHAFGRRVP